MPICHSYSFEAAIFDMDGLLIDSEPFWREVEISVFGQLNMVLTDSMCYQTAGMRLDAVVAYWLRYFEKQDLDAAAIQHDITEAYIKLVQQKGRAMKGVAYILDFFKQRNLKIGLASSSSERIIKAVLERLQIELHFEAICSAQYEKQGKPHPGVFLTAAQKMTVSPTRCLVFEDAYNGVMAARAAQMTVVAIPDPHYFDSPIFDIAHLKLPSLQHFEEKHLIELQQIARLA